MLRAYKTEILPTLEQALKIRKTIGVCRYLYNLYLASNFKVYETLGKGFFVTGYTFDRYVDTVFHLYKKDPAFSDKIKNSKGFCTYHFALLYDRAPSYLPKDVLGQFLSDIKSTYFDNMKRMQEDIEWFINKFDYRYQNEPWKNSKDALPRAVLKTHSAITPDIKE